MFGISFTEILVIIFFTILLVHPREYSALLQKIKKTYIQFRKAYSAALKELDNLKEESGLNEIDRELKEDIENIDEAIKQIEGDDGKLYDSYDIASELELDKKRRDGKK